MTEPTDLPAPPSDLWKRVDPIPLGKAAWLWRGKSPATPGPMPDDVHAVHSLLKAAVMRGDLVAAADPDSDKRLDKWSTATRAALRAFAATLGDVPAFLQD